MSADNKVPVGSLYLQTATYGKESLWPRPQSSEHKQVKAGALLLSVYSCVSPITPKARCTLEDGMVQQLLQT